ncbi:MAG TPA: hypothetical protein VJN18_20730 [Polyangiaceae bacterium]|nr:hypothetical protein [Polyangiaceae bacterium]
MRKCRLLCLVAIVGWGCSSSREDGGNSSQNIYNANSPATTAEQNGVAFLDIVNPGSVANGTAVALTNRTFLTART